MPLAMGQITHLLPEWRAGSRDAENRLFELVLPNVRRLAHYLMKGERKDHSLELINLIDQAYIPLQRTGILAEPAAFLRYTS
jgi:hypothetical protein